MENKRESPLPLWAVGLISVGIIVVVFALAALWGSTWNPAD